MSDIAQSKDAWSYPRWRITETGHRLRLLRQAAGLTMLELCDALDLPPDPAAISRIETGNGVPGPAAGERLTAWMDYQTSLQTPESSETGSSAISMPITAPTPPRATHPATSRRAMDSINRENAWAIHNWILEELSHVDFGLTHEQLWERLERDRTNRPDDAPRSSQSGLRTRVSELVRGGVVQDSGRTRTMTTGRQAIVWELA